jgi:carboxyl-terminal processing protease
MRFLSSLLCFVIVTVSSYTAEAKGVEDTSRNRCLQLAGKRLHEAFALMQKHYYKKDAVNWDSLFMVAKTRLTASGTCEDAYETVNWCFRQISEMHSFIMPAASAAVYTNDTVVLNTPPKLSRLVGELRGELLNDRSIAYLNIPWISTSDDVICRRIADSIQGLIETLDKKGAEKWIVDLRQNSGGNCWPMLAGLGPLLGDGICGYFVTDDTKLPIIYREGAAMQGSKVRCKVSRPYNMNTDKKWIIVLTGPKTSSSGEIVAIAFKGKEHTLLYGQPTAGFTTANASYPLSDKSLLVLSVCMEADRTGKIYEGKIQPDEVIHPDLSNPGEDAAKAAAVRWLQMQ